MSSVPLSSTTKPVVHVLHDISPQPVEYEEPLVPWTRRSIASVNIVFYNFKFSNFLFLFIVIPPFLGARIELHPRFPKSLLPQFIIPMPVLLSSQSGWVKGEGGNKEEKGKERNDIVTSFLSRPFFCTHFPFATPKKLKDYKVIISK
jgi:hypothetical protein